MIYSTAFDHETGIAQRFMEIFLHFLRENSPLIRRMKLGQF